MIKIPFLLTFLFTLLSGQEAAGYDSLVNNPIRKKIIIKGDQFYPPYEFINEKGEPDGFNVELFRELAKELNLDYELYLEPWIQVRNELERGDIDGVTGMLISSERAQHIEFGLPHSVMTQGIFSRKDAKIKNLEDLRGLEVIVQEGDIMHDYLLKNPLTEHIIAVPDLLAGLRLLENGQHDAALMGNFQGAYLLDKHQIKNVVLKSSDIEPQRYAMATKKGADELIWTLNMGLYQLKTNGTYDRLYNKWFGIYEQGYQYKRLEPYFFGLVLFVLILSIFLLLLRRQVKRTIQKLSASESRFRTISDLSPVGMGIIHKETFVEVSRRLSDITGYGQEELIGQHVSILHFSKADFYRVHNNLLEQLASKGFGSCEDQLRKKDGQGIEVIITSGRIENDANLDHFIFTCTDITFQKSAQQEINITNERLRIQLENSPLAVIETDENLNIKTWSPQAEHFFGWSRDEVMGKNVRQYPRVEKGEEIVVENVLRRLVNGSQKRNVSINQNYAKDGSVLYCEWYNSAMYDKNGRFMSLFSMVNNVTDLRAAERKNQLDQQRLYWTIDAAKIGIWEWNIPSGHIQFNGNYAAILGYQSDELPPHLDTWKTLTHPDDLAKAVELIDQHFKNPEIVFEIEIRMRHKKGHWVTVLDRGSVISRTAEGQPLLMVGTHTDISMTKAVQKQVEQNEIRLNSMVSLMQKATVGVQDLLDFALEEALQLTESQIGYIYTFDESTQRFEMATCSNNVMEQCDIPPRDCVELSDAGIWGEAVRQRKPVVLNNFEEQNPLKKGYPEGHVPIRKFMTVPVISNDQVVMVMGLANKEVDYTHSDILQLSVLMDTIWRMIEKKKSDTQLKKLSVATEQSPASIIITDMDGRIEFANDRFISTTGYSFEELRGHVLRVLRPAHTPEPAFSELWNTIKSGRNWKGEHQNKRKSGELYWEAVNISSIKNGEEAITNYVVVSEDISREKALKQELIAAKEKAEENDNLKTAFLNNLSHEVRTPMNAIVGFSEFLTDEDIAADKRAIYAKTILKSSTQLLNLMENIINMAIIESGQVKINKTKVSINQLLNDVYNQISVSTPKKDITLRVNSMISKVNDEVMMDQTKVVQILFNLLGNAFKFTEKGLIQFGCKIDNAQLVFHVEDTGIGFPEEKRELLYEKFRQGSNSLTGLNDGMGLGLSISKSYIDLMGGSIQLTSSLKQGTRIEFTVPYQPVITVHNEPIEASKMRLKPNTTILVADDVEVNHLIILEMLEDHDLTIFYARNGEEAIEMVKNHPEINLILMDIKMPVMDGYKATIEIKKIKPELPIIAQTAYALAGDKEKALEAGCDDYISKPIKKEALIQILRKHL
ncbi:PAS domain S-box protein [Geofilum rubicundum]|nr:PAS domain S-box protein [Geofilum rubicundum]